MDVREEAEEAAVDLLKVSWTHGAPLQNSPLPIDPIKIARSLNLTVVTVELDDPTLAGMLVKRRNQEPAIYLNAKDHPNRQRFTCAHEIGHYVRRAKNGRDSDEWEFIDYRNTLSSQGTDVEEMYANRFGAALLMPGKMIREMREVFGPPALAVMFSVSLEAMGNRLASLGLPR
jgi:Zn-dependent peptidase ImmA (M78 family)